MPAVKANLQDVTCCCRDCQIVYDDVILVGVDLLRAAAHFKAMRCPKCHGRKQICLASKPEKLIAEGYTRHAS